MAELKWSPCDSPHHEKNGECFDASNAIIDDVWKNVDPDSDMQYNQTCQIIRETCLSAINELNASGYFKNSEVVLNLLIGDRSDQEE